MKLTSTRHFFTMVIKSMRGFAVFGLPFVSHGCFSNSTADFLCWTSLTRHWARNSFILHSISCHQYEWKILWYCLQFWPSVYMLESWWRQCRLQKNSTIHFNLFCETYNFEHGAHWILEISCEGRSLLGHFNDCDPRGPDIRGCIVICACDNFRCLHWFPYVSDMIGI